VPQLGGSERTQLSVATLSIARSENAFSGAARRLRSMNDIHQSPQVRLYLTVYWDIGNLNLTFTTSARSFQKSNEENKS